MKIKVLPVHAYPYSGCDAKVGDDLYISRGGSDNNALGVHEQCHRIEPFDHHAEGKFYSYVSVLDLIFEGPFIQPGEFAPDSLLAESPGLQGGVTMSQPSFSDYRPAAGLQVK
jgi:hypothetical protein